LISAIISDQELDIYAAALPGGVQRTRNLNALNARAETFEQTSYHGIFHFIRYIERLMKSDTDAGEPGASEESGNAVRIMTIHKSKGLEFPVVFLCGLGKGMNKKELGNGVIMHPVLGVGMDLIHYDTRVKEKCLLRTALRDQLERENVGEELRVLYVAMTRARDRLYLTANAPSLEKLLKDYGDLWEQEPETLSDTELLGASNMLDWLLRAWREGSSLDLKLIRDEDLLYEALRTEDAEKQVRTALESELMPEDEASDRIRDTARKTFSYQYRYDDLYTVRPTMSVSMLKMEHIEELQEESEPLFADVPAGENGGARRGTLYHLVMERSDPAEKAEENISRMIREGALTEEEAAMIDPVKIDAFFGSDVGKRFIRARENGKAFREKSFIIGVPAAGVRKVKLVRSPEELVMIQGIIDMYFEEDGELVVVDYKTDRVRDARELIDRYQLQLELYEKALEQITGKKVREKIIWSFALNCEIPV
ncbi:MAG: PD-(D/E)XK nuclease family protein, partial [Lachnospiraceae bacterium]|nr:PD-(D/E)XK nuclease family protein [Lachnospiraceae bacterium]